MFIIPPLMIFEIINSVLYSRSKASNSETLHWAHTIYDVVTSVGLLGLHVFGFMRADQVRAILETVNEMGVSVIGNVVPLRLVILNFLLMASSITYVTVGWFVLLWLEPFLTSLPLYTLTIRYLILAIYVALFSVVFQTNVEYGCQALRKVYKPCFDLAKHGSMNAMINLSIEPQIKIPVNDRFDVSLLHVRSYKYRNPAHGKILPEPPLEIEDINIAAIKSQTLKIYAYVQLIKSYASPFILILLSMLVSSQLVSLFYLSMWGDMTLGYRCLTVSHVIITIFPVIYLVNTPSCFQDMVII